MRLYYNGHKLEKWNDYKDDSTWWQDKYQNDIHWHFDMNNEKWNEDDNWHFNDMKWQMTDTNEYPERNENTLWI